MKRIGSIGVIVSLSAFSGLAMGQVAPPPAPAAAPPAPAAAPPVATAAVPPPAEGVPNAQPPVTPGVGAGVFVEGEAAAPEPAVEPARAQPVPTEAVAATAPTEPVGAGAATTPPPQVVDGAEVAPVAGLPAEPAPDEPSFKFYGIGRLDAAYATGRMQNVELGLWARQRGADGDYESEFTINPRWSRFGVDWDGGGLGGEDAAISAKVEIDFHGGGSQSRATPRMMHAYGQVQMGDVSILGGQTWDLYAPLIAGGMEQAILWYGGNLGDRRPQLRVTYAPTFGPATLVVAAAAVQSGAVDMEDLDGDQVMDGNAWARPAGQGLVELKLGVEALGAKPIRVGASGHYGGKTLSISGKDEDFEVYAVVGHLEVPIDRITLRGELWTGANLSDLRGGIGQGLALTDEDLDATTFENGDEIAASGGWVHVNVAPVEWYSVTVGVGRDKLSDPGPGQRSRNDTLDFANVFSPWKPVKLGLAYDHYWTDYVTGKDASVSRYMAYTMVSF